MAGAFSTRAALAAAAAARERAAASRPRTLLVLPGRWGLCRDELPGYLWPERDPEHAPLAAAG